METKRIGRFVIKNTREPDLEVTVEDIRCAHCSVAIKSALRKLEGVREVRVNRRSKHVIVKLDPASSLDINDLVDALAAIGYKADPA